MMPIDWTSVALGLIVGTLGSALFFAGLGVGMRIALRSSKPVASLAISAFVRIACLLGIGWLATVYGGPWSLTAFALAFLLVRFLATSLVRSDVSIGTSS